MKPNNDQNSLLSKNAGFRPITTCSRPRLHSFILTVLTVLLVLSLRPAAARADILVVNDTSDNPGSCVKKQDGTLEKGCTLRAAVSAFSVASKLGQTNFIDLPEGDYTLKDSLRIEGEPGIGDYPSTYKREKGPVIIIRGAGIAKTVLYGACGKGSSKRALMAKVFQSTDYDLDYESCNIGPGFATIIVRKAFLQLQNMTIRDGLQNFSNCTNGRCYATITNFFGEMVLSLTAVTHNSGIMAGGILNMGGSLTVMDSMISQNFAGDVGGISTIVNGVTTILNSTISNNFGLSGGGIKNSNDVDGGLTSIGNSTISDNKTKRGAAGVSTEATSYCVSCHMVTDRGYRDTWLNYVTVTENRVQSAGVSTTDTGGVSGEHVYLMNSIVAKNRQNFFVGRNYTSSPSDCNGQVLSAGGNIIGTTGSSCSVTLIQGLPSPPAKWSGTLCKMRSIDQVVCSVGAIDPFKYADLKDQDPWLGPLADNGGNTCTHLLLGGPAVNHGWTGATGGFAVNPYDQRWAPRNGTSDSGAVMFGGKPGQVGLNCAPN